jgi:hypothetical protein
VDPPGLGFGSGACAYTSTLRLFVTRWCDMLSRLLHSYLRFAGRRGTTTTIPTTAACPAPLATRPPARPAQQQQPRPRATASASRSELPCPQLRAPQAQAPLLLVPVAEVAAWRLPLQAPLLASVAEAAAWRLGQSTPAGPRAAVCPHHCRCCLPRMAAGGAAHARIPGGWVVVGGDEGRDGRKQLQ